MGRVKLDQETWGLSLLMEKITGAKVKDCFRDEDTVYFVVAPGELGKAIGKSGVNVHRLQAELGKRVKVIEFNEIPFLFIKNIIYPLAVEEIIEEGTAFVVKDRNRMIKSKLIGRESKNLKVLNRAVQRFFSKDVKVG